MISFSIAVMAEPRVGSPSIVKAATTETDKTAENTLPEGVENSKSSSFSSSLVSGEENCIETKGVMASTTSGEESESGVEKQSATTELSESALASATSAVASDPVNKNADDGLQNRHLSSSQSSDASQSTKGDDVDFDPSSELNEFDDEAVRFFFYFIRRLGSFD